ncbi:MAG: hypothetical protein KAS32_10595 [Candidatus Peribacteraceae bacterium]|nr:hypothetical protein [Candidatus Peribacteraceae bacterium]
MCQWFSCVSNGKGKIYYMDENHRKTIYDGGEVECKTGQNNITTRDELDSHSAICAYYGLSCDRVNKYEFRPLDKHFIVDQINTYNDKVSVENQVRKFDFRKLAPPELALRPIFRPFEDADRKRVTKKDLILLKEWASVWDSVWASVRASVRDSVWASVRDSVRDSVWASVRDSVRASVWASVRASVWASVRASVWDSVRDSVWDSMWAYWGSFFILEKWRYIEHAKGVYPYQSIVDLWHKGIVPSFDGKIWRLHAKSGILKEITAKELKSI